MAHTEPNRAGQSHSITYEADGTQSLVTLLTEAIANCLDTDPLDVGPLYDSIDVDATTDFVESLRTNNAHGGYVELVVQGCRVTITTDDDVVVYAEQIVAPDQSAEQPTTSECVADSGHDIDVNRNS